MGKQQDDEAILSRNLPLPKYVWNALDEDAKRCGRSSVKQVLALLTAYYDLGDMDLNKEGFERMRLASIPLGSKHASEPTEAIPTDIGPGRQRATSYLPSKKGGGK